jgi:hypothetical protein
MYGEGWLREDNSVPVRENVDARPRVAPPEPTAKALATPDAFCRLNRACSALPPTATV